MPTVAVRCTSWPATRSGSRALSTSRRASASASLSLRKVSLHTANSAPAMRATVFVDPPRAVEQLTDSGEDLVAGVVAERVVDHLDPIDVDQQHRHHRRRTPPRSGNRLVDSVDEQRSVGQPCDEVVQRVMAQRLLGGMALGHIAGVDNDPVHQWIVEQVVGHDLEVVADAETVDHVTDAGAWIPVGRRLP